MVCYQRQKAGVKRTNRIIDSDLLIEHARIKITYMAETEKIPKLWLTILSGFILPAIRVLTVTMDTRVLNNRNLQVRKLGRNRAEIAGDRNDN